MKVLFFFEEAEQQLVEAAVQVPVDVPKVVAARVGAVIGELDAGTDLASATLRAQVSREHLARHHVEVLERLQELFAEQAAAILGGVRDARELRDWRRNGHA